MIDKHYHENAIKTYGEQCEICGWVLNLEAHHIDYQEHQDMETQLRKLYKTDGFEFSKLMEKAKTLGYEEWRDNQLAKNDDTKNIAVLCGNHHSLVHAIDTGKLLLNALKPRR